MDSEIDKKFLDNYEVLEQWHKSIENYYVLSSKEAKHLMRLFLNEKDEEKKVEIRNVIVLGTLEYLYQFLKQSVFINLICNWFDMEDVINASIETWINYISKGNKYSKAYRYDLNSTYILYSQYFFNHILGNLNSRKDCSAGDFSSKELHNLMNWYYLYLKESKNNPNFGYENFKKMVIGASNGNDERLRKIYDIFKYINRVLKINYSLINIDTINSLKFLLYIIGNMGTIWDDAIWDERAMLDRIFACDLASNVLSFVATPKGKISEKGARLRKEILIKNFYEDKDLTTIANEMGFRLSRVQKLESDCLIRIKEKYKSGQDDIES